MVGQPLQNRRATASTRLLLSMAQMKGERWRLVGRLAEGVAAKQAWRPDVVGVDYAREAQRGRGGGRRESDMAAWDPRWTGEAEERLSRKLQVKSILWAGEKGIAGD